jgi:hypothetical protein
MKKVIVFIASVIVLSSCHKEIPKKQSIDIDISGEMQQVNNQTLTQDPSNQNNFISAVDSITKYGFGYKIVIPDTLKGKTLKVIYSGSFKESESLTGELVLSVHEQNMSTLFWATYPTTRVVKKPGEWVNFKDSAMIFADKNPKTAMYLFLFNQKNTGKGLLYVDNLKLKIYKD